MSATLSPTPLAINAAPKSRIWSVDLIRGAVMILMAIDHVRVYSGRRPHGRSLFHPVDHPFLCAGIHLPGRDQHLHFTAGSTATCHDIY